MTKKELLDELKRLQEQLKEIEEQEKKARTAEQWLIKETLKLFKLEIGKILTDFFPPQDGLRSVKINVNGFDVQINPTKTVTTKKVASNVTIEKNRAVEQVSSKETITQKVERMSELNPHLHITNSAKKYPKSAKAWLVKNFGTVEV